MNIWRTIKNSLLPHGPTKGWRRSPSFEQTIDLDDGSICGLRIGQPEFHLEALGQATFREIDNKCNCYKYADIGLYIATVNDKIDHISISNFLGEDMDDVDESSKLEGWMIVAAEQSVRLLSLQSIGALISVVGKPDFTETEGMGEDTSEVLHYSRDGVVIEIEFQGNGVCSIESVDRADSLMPPQQHD